MQKAQGLEPLGFVIDQSSREDLVRSGGAGSQLLLLLMDQT
jgi:hypothetical protein